MSLKRRNYVKENGMEQVVKLPHKTPTTKSYILARGRPYLSLTLGVVRGNTERENNQLQSNIKTN